MSDTEIAATVVDFFGKLDAILPGYAGDLYRSLSTGSAIPPDQASWQATLTQNDWAPIECSPWWPFLNTGQFDVLTFTMLSLRGFYPSLGIDFVGPHHEDQGPSPMREPTDEELREVFELVVSCWNPLRSHIRTSLQTRAAHPNKRFAPPMPEYKGFETPGHVNYRSDTVALDHEPPAGIAVHPFGPGTIIEVPGASWHDDTVEFVLTVLRPYLFNLGPVQPT